MERKAWENLDAARVLLNGEDPCPNAAASRAYYAAYHACWAVMVRKGHPVPEARPGARYFRHDTLPDDACDAQVLNEQESRELHLLQSWRISADYHEDEVMVEQAQEALKSAETLVNRLLGEKPEW